MMLHADGPWQVAPYRDHPNGPIYILDSTGKTAVAQVISGRIDGTGMANAHLIAAAPDLLDALQSLVDMDVAFQRGPKVDNAVENARAAISKAIGENQCQQQS